MRLLKKNWFQLLLLATFSIGAYNLAEYEIVYATRPTDGEHKITICHRSNSVTNPWQSTPVDYSAIDGGQDNDHSQHTEGIPLNEAAAQIMKDNKQKWGDIIPPVPDVNPGQNWTDAGVAIYNNDCNFVAPPIEETPPPTDDETTPPLVEGNHNEPIGE